MRPARPVRVPGRFLLETAARGAGLRRLRRPARRGPLTVGPSDRPDRLTVGLSDCRTVPTVGLSDRPDRLTV
jgi:hypothetical protein